MLRSRSLFAATALTLFAALGVAGSASAGQLNMAPTSQHALGQAFSVYGPATGLALNNNAVQQENFKLHSGGYPVRMGGNRMGGYPYPMGGQINAAPTSQTAVSTAVGIGGPATSAAINQNSISQGNGRVGGFGPQISIAPTVQTAVAGAVSVGGPATATAINSNNVSQGNLN